MQLSKPSQAKIPLPIPTHPLLPYRRRHPGARPNSFRIHPTSLPRIPQLRVDVLGLPLNEHWRKPDTVPGEALCPPLKPDAVPPPPGEGHVSAEPLTWDFIRLCCPTTPPPRTSGRPDDCITPDGRA